MAKKLPTYCRIEEAGSRLVVHVDLPIYVMHYCFITRLNSKLCDYEKCGSSTELMTSAKCFHCFKWFLILEHRRLKQWTKHILPDDCRNKVGTKHATMACNPAQYLTNLGEADTLSEQDATLPRRSLVRVWAGERATTNADTFDDRDLYLGQCWNWIARS